MSVAITAGDLKLWRLLDGCIPRGGRVLELGEANWYLDAPDARG